jgi:hypothetical protein
MKKQWKKREQYSDSIQDIINNHNNNCTVHAKLNLVCRFDLPIEIQTNTESVFSSYFPSTTKTEKFLGVEQRTSLEDSLLRWKDWLTSKPRN